LHKAKQQSGHANIVAGVLSGVLATLILAVFFVAVSPELHMALHGQKAIEATSSCDHEHDHGRNHTHDNEPSDSHETCGICLFAHGAVLQAEVGLPSLLPINHLTIAVVRPESVGLTSPRFILLPERAPPSLG
jgi:hypothetical protein